jgi:gluconate kinase
MKVAPAVLVVMGVSGAGKAIAAELSRVLGLRLQEGEGLRLANVEIDRLQCSIARQHRYTPPSLRQSQLDTREQPAAVENPVTVILQGDSRRDGS